MRGVFAASLLLVLPFSMSSSAALQTATPESTAVLPKGFHTAGYTVLGGMTRREETFERAEARTKPDQIVLRPQGATPETQALVVYKVTSPKVPFRDALLSWNCSAPKGTGVVVEMRVARTAEEAGWSPWMRVGSWGDVVEPAGETAASSCEGGRIEEGIFLGDGDFARLQARVRGLAASASAKDEIVVTRLGIELRNRSVPDGKEEIAQPKAVALNVPFAGAATTRDEGADLAAAIAMLLGSRGVDVPVKRVADVLMAPGGSPTGARGVQVAYSLGGAGSLTSIASWGKVQSAFGLGYAPAIHVEAAAGELKGAPEGARERRWLVLTGFDKDGNCLARDPAAADGGRKAIAYSRADLERVWLAKGGTTILIDSAVKKAK